MDRLIRKLASEAAISSIGRPTSMRTRWRTLAKRCDEPAAGSARLENVAILVEILEAAILIEILVENVGEPREWTCSLNILENGFVNFRIETLRTIDSLAACRTLQNITKRKSRL
eukprot:scaffold98418_cov69-Phaeocystis_antarctica.AAC.5